MVKGVILLSVVPVRAEAKESAEMLTQLLFAETVEVLEQQPRWLRVRNETDGQEGWVDAKMIRIMTDKEAAKYAKAKKSARITTLMAFAAFGNLQIMLLTPGTLLPDYRNGSFKILDTTYTIHEQFVSAKPLKMTAKNVHEQSLIFLNAPYLWGGKNAFGIDCSGFTQVVHSLFGHQLLRNASEQATQGVEVPSLADAKPGDLAFFDHEDGKICHVGLIWDKGFIIHCSGRVKIEKLDEKGIYSDEQGTYTHHLVQIRRIES